MRTLYDLIDHNDTAWPLVQKWVAGASGFVEVLSTKPEAGESALLATQVTTRSPLGAVTFHTAGILIDNGWLRVLGAGGHPRFERSLPAWNEQWNPRQAKALYVIADDVLGGVFALDGGAFGNAPEERGGVYYFAPDSLKWEPCKFGYSGFLAWALSGKLAEFYASFRWDGWEKEVKELTADQALNVYPFLSAKGAPIAERSRRAVPVSEQYALFFDTP